MKRLIRSPQRTPEEGGGRPSPPKLMLSRVKVRNQIRFGVLPTLSEEMPRLRPRLRPQDREPVGL